MDEFGPAGQPRSVQDAIDVILHRRSARFGFSRDPVAREVIDTLLACGDAAPSSKGARPWHFHPVSDLAVLDAMASWMAAAAGVEEYVPIDPATGLARSWGSTVIESADVLRLVPVAIVIENRGRFSTSRSTVAAAAPSVLENALVGYAFELLGIGAAIQNLWLAASQLGLGAVFIGDVLVVESTIKRHLGIEGDLVGVFACGWLVGQDATDGRSN